MSRSAGDPTTPATKDNSTTTSTTQSPSEQTTNALHSSQDSSSGASSTYSSSSSSSRRHLSSGNTSPPCTLPTPTSKAEERDFPIAATSKLHFSPANRSILQQSLDIDQRQFADSSSRVHRLLNENNNSDTGGGGAGAGGVSNIDTTMQPAPSTSVTVTPSSIAFHDNHKYTESVNGQSNSQRPANKARRTSSGGSRVPGEDVGRRSGQGGSSASDSGSDWPHGPKVHSATPSLIPPPPATSISGNSVVGVTNVETDEQLASTSSNYFTSNLSRKGSETGGRNVSHPQMDLAKYPAQDLLRILAALLAQIATANDNIRPKSSAATAEDSNGKQKRRDQNTYGQDSRITSSSSGGSQPSLQPSDLSIASRRPSLATLSPTQHDRPTTAALGALETPSSTLCFHARNVPSISIESYLLRILKYCPATNEVFLSLLIYFDRMSKMGSSSSLPSQSANTTSELDMASENEAGIDAEAGNEKTSAITTATGSEDDDTFAGMKGFAIDSYNVHRLVIAGVTVASKFFSDVFYTNSRYAKVGGLPVHELNQLELQFLLLNDFRLVIPLEEMQRYADQLLIYGGIAKSAWSEGMEGRKVSGATTPADRSAIEAVSRQEQRSDSIKEP